MEKFKIISDNIDIKKMHVFLCGSYYRNEKNDKRYILKNSINTFEDLYPVIIDKSFNVDGFIDRELNLALMEEIIANIAQLTIIIIESFSSSAELGLFAGSGKKNQILLVIPNLNDIENNKIGYFIMNGFNQDNYKFNLKFFKYRPAVSRVAINSNIVDEYYYFPNDIIPDNIKEHLSSVNTSKNSLISLDVFRIENSISPLLFGQIGFYLSNDIVHVKISTFLLFHMCEKIVLSKIRKKTFVLSEYLYVINEVKAIIFNTLIYKIKDLKKNYRTIDKFIFQPDINVDFDNIIKHICHIVFLFSRDNNLERYNDFSSIDIFEEVEAKYFRYSIYDALLVSPDEIILPSKKNTEKGYVIKNNKKREFVKYHDSEDGLKLRNIHNKISSELKKKFTYNNRSFAYKENTGILDYLKCHVKCSFFITYDIKHFFNEIKKEFLVQKIYNLLDIDQEYGYVNDLINTLFIKDGDNFILPLGFVSSPVISEVYMQDFDKVLSCYSHDNQLIYTRYADDICFSSKSPINRDDLEIVISDELNKLGLSLNDKKTQNKILKHDGDHIRMLGVSLVKRRNNNSLYLTVGSKYINSLANEIVGNSKLNYDNDDYIRSRILGKIGFIKYINVDNLEVLIKKIRLYSVGNTNEILRKYNLF